MMDQCEEKAIHVEKVKQVISRLPEHDTLQGVADIFKALSDPGQRDQLLNGFKAALAALGGEE